MTSGDCIDQTGASDDELRAPARKGDVSAWNRLGVRAETDGDFVRATAMYYAGLTLFNTVPPRPSTTPEKGGQGRDVREKNRAILTVNCRRAFSAVVKSEYPALEALAEEVEAELAEGPDVCGLDGPFVGGLPLAARYKAFYLGQLHGYAPFLSLLLIAFLANFMESLVPYAPHLLKPGLPLFKGLDNMGFVCFAGLLLVFLPVMSTAWVFCKYSLWIVAYFSVGAMGQASGPLLYALARLFD